MGFNLHHITEILLKVGLKTITITLTPNNIYAMVALN
jgi:hypothetical protein